MPELLCEDGLPSLLCRPCERRLDNFNKFRKIVCEVQSGLIHKKRCINESPSALISNVKNSRGQFSGGNVSSRHCCLSFGQHNEVHVQSYIDSSIQVCHLQKKLTLPTDENRYSTFTENSF